MNHTLHCGDALDVLPTLEAGSVQTCVTSPPYFGLRSYLSNGHPDKGKEVGLDRTPETYISRLVGVFREVRRVLHDTGTLWLNLGDSYSGGGGFSPDAPSNRNGNDRNGAGRSRLFESGRRRPASGLKPKDLLGIPWRVAFALQADGWVLRSAAPWLKRNAMPESVKDRPASAVEYVFLFAKGPRYFYDADAVRKPLSDVSQSMVDKFERDGARPGRRGKAVIPGQSIQGGITGVGRGSLGACMSRAGRNRRNSDWWFDSLTLGDAGEPLAFDVPTRPYKGAHFAVFPEALVEPCVLAGCPAGGLVLDPFCGSGTVGAVALRHGRRFVGIDLSADYLKLAAERIGGVPAAA